MTTRTRRWTLMRARWSARCDADPYRAPLVRIRCCTAHRADPAAGTCAAAGRGSLLCAVGVGHDRVVDVRREAGLDLVVAGRVPGVGGVQLGQAAVLGVPAVVEP